MIIGDLMACYYRYRRGRLISFQEKDGILFQNAHGALASCGIVSRMLGCCRGVRLLHSRTTGAAHSSSRGSIAAADTEARNRSVGVVGLRRDKNDLENGQNPTRRRTRHNVNTVHAGVDAMAARQRCVLVTGASRGLGLELCKQYAAAGWNVFAACREGAEAASVKELISTINSCADQGQSSRCNWTFATPRRCRLWARHWTTEASVSTSSITMRASPSAVPVPSHPARVLHTTTGSCA